MGTCITDPENVLVFAGFSQSQEQLITLSGEE